MALQSASARWGLGGVFRFRRDASRLIRTKLGFRSKKMALSVAEASAEHRRLMDKYASYTMTPATCQWALLSAIDYVDRNGIPGDIVECGVWRGGNVMMAKEARRGRQPKRQIYLFDTFEGMTKPASIDRSKEEGSAMERFQRMARNGFNAWCYASIEEVQANFISCGLDLDGATFVKGPVEETLLDDRNLPKKIAILRLDTDWYASTKLELDVLYPRLSNGGVIFIDDYGTWEGSRAATDEYFGNCGPLLHVVSSGCRCAVKP